MISLTVDSRASIRLNVRLDEHQTSSSSLLEINLLLFCLIDSYPRIVLGYEVRIPDLNCSLICIKVRAEVTHLLLFLWWIIDLDENTR